MSIQQLSSEPPESNVSSDTDSVTCYTPSTSSADENDLSQTYSSYDSYWSSINTCPLCSSLYLDDRIADDQAVSYFPSRHYTTSEYSDFRASSRAQQRARKIRENKSGYNSHRCRKVEQAQQDTRNLKKKREGLKWAVRESQKEVPCYTASFRRRTRHCFVGWDTRLEEDMDEWVQEMEDDILHYITLYYGAETFVSEEPYVEAGENFAVWCQRRIAEMRVVKGDPEDTPISCSRCCAESGSTHYECFCREGKCAPAPEERQRCSLVEWVGQEGKEIIRMEQAREEKSRLHDSDDDVALSKPERDCGWDIISIASSETWSAVDANVV